MSETERTCFDLKKCVLVFLPKHILPFAHNSLYWLFLKNKDRKFNVMDKIWDRKSFEVGGHNGRCGRDEKNRMTLQNRQKSNAKINHLPHIS